MAGGQVPYHLRVNKAIDRQIFIDALVRYHGFHCLSGFAYVSFGGPFLADYRLLDAHLSLARLISLEEDPTVFGRQKFNNPGRSIECRLQKSGEFLSKIEDEKVENFILWLDYAAANQRRVQLEELQAFIEKLPPYAVLKITMNANVVTLPGVPGALQAPEVFKKRLESADNQLGEYLKAGVTEKDMTRDAFPRVVLGCMRRAIAKGLRTRPELKFEPFTSFVYSDGHAMLTLTGALLPASDRKKCREVMRLREWPLSFAARKAPISINTPVLSMRERSFCEAKLPGPVGALAKSVKFKLSADEAEHFEHMKSFSRFARYYPQFSRIVP
jgi:hypothetical protein